MPKKKPIQPPENRRNGAWPEGLALNNGGFNELAAYLGCSNWFAQELVRHGHIPHVTMGDRIIVARREAELWLERYTKSPEYQALVKEWLQKHPGEKIRMPDEGPNPLRSLPNDQLRNVFTAFVPMVTADTVQWREQIRQKLLALPNLTPEQVEDIVNNAYKLTENESLEFLTRRS